MYSGLPIMKIRLIVQGSSLLRVQFSVFRSLGEGPGEKPLGSLCDSITWILPLCLPFEGLQWLSVICLPSVTALMALFQNITISHASAILYYTIR